MMRYSGLLTAALSTGLALAGSTTMASANNYYRGCGSCGAPTTSRIYRTVYPTSSVTRYRDLSVYNRMPRIHQVVTVTRVQPIVRIHEVTRVHHHTIFYPRYTYASVTQNLAPISYVSRSVVNTYECGCHP